MAKTKRELKENLAVVDMVLEVRDARIPVTSHNADLAEIVAKACDYSPAKADWQRLKPPRFGLRLRKDGLPTAAVDSKSGRGLRELERAPQTAPAHESKT